MENGTRDGRSVTRLALLLLFAEPALHRTRADGIVHTMNAATQAPIDSAGRVVIPKAIRERAGLYGGMVFDIVVRDDAVIELRPAPRAINIEMRDGLPVAMPIELSEPLSVEVVDETLRRLREERSG